MYYHQCWEALIWSDRRSPFCGRIVTLDHWPSRSLEGLVRSLLVQYCNPEGAKLHFYFQVFQHGNVRFTIYILISTWKCHFFHFHTHFNMEMELKFLFLSSFDIFSKFIHRNALKNVKNTIPLEFIHICIICMEKATAHAQTSVPSIYTQHSVHLSSVAVQSSSRKVLCTFLSRTLVILFPNSISISYYTTNTLLQWQNQVFQVSIPIFNRRMADNQEVRFYF